LTITGIDGTGIVDIDIFGVGMVVMSMQSKSVLAGDLDPNLNDMMIKIPLF